MSTHEGKSRPAALIVGAIGVVFGDIGTSPLYALKETFAGHHPMSVEPASILGVLSLIFWTIMALVTLKYVAIIMRADNRGEGGSLALLARVTELTKNSRATWFVTMLGIFAAALFYGDSMITPAISVLSAVEGLEIITPDLKPYVIPLTLLILTGLFFIQKHGTGAVGIGALAIGNVKYQTQHRLLVQTYQLLKGETDTGRALWLETLVVLLILFEIVMALVRAGH